MICQKQEQRYLTGAVGGSVLASDDAVDLGSSSKQWRDIYTGDINLNNTKTRDNEVDRTRGSWTIQEGKDDLYILNRLNGKKYRFKLGDEVMALIVRHNSYSAVTNTTGTWTPSFIAGTIINKSV